MLLHRAKNWPTSSYLIAFWVVVYFIVILQDYFFSAFRQTGFYWSEVSLFNLYWLLFIPFCWCAQQLIFHYHIKYKKKALQIFCLLVLAFTFSIIHLVVFSGLISTISALVFSPSHSFERILMASLSKDYWISFLVYAIVPYWFSIYSGTSFNTFHESEQEKELGKKQNHFLQIKHRNEHINIDLSTILFIQADKPYSRIITLERDYLTNQSLKALTTQLTFNYLIRIHRSTIVNTAQIKKIASRKNGDYDLIMNNGAKLRCSRHFRKNWKHLL